MDSRTYENMMAELAKLGIHDAEGLRKAIEELPPLDLGIMTGKLQPGKEEANNGR